MFGPRRRFSVRGFSVRAWGLSLLALVLIAGIGIAYAIEGHVGETERRLKNLVRENAYLIDSYVRAGLTADAALLPSGSTESLDTGASPGARTVATTPRLTALPRSAAPDDPTAAGVLADCPDAHWAETVAGIDIGAVSTTADGTLQAAVTLAEGDRRLGGCIGLDRLIGWWRAMEWPEGTAIALLDREETILLRLADGAVGTNIPVAGGPLTRAIAAHPGPSGLTTLLPVNTDGVRRTVAWQALPTLGVTLAAGYSTRATTVRWLHEIAPLLAASLLVALIFPTWMGFAHGRLLAASAESEAQAQRLRLAMDSGGFGLWDYRFAGDRLEWDARMFRLFGVEPATFQGRFDDWKSTVLPEDLEGASAAFLNAAAAGGRFEATFRIVRSDTGAVRWMQAVADIIRDDAGGTVRAIGVNWDVTESMQARHALAQRLEEAQEANAAKDRFLANLSHELRTPLNAILGFTEMLRMPGLVENADKRAEYLADIHGSSTHLLSLINDMLTLAKLRNGKGDLEVGSVDLHEALEEVRPMVAPHPTDTGPALVWPADCPDTRVLGDRRAIRQVLANLVGNALKFTPPGGRVEVAVERDGTADETGISVTDDGPGMSPAQVAQFGQPFAKGSTPYQANAEGMGLGLAISKQLAEAMGGRLTLVSKPGHGTRVTLHLPALAALPAQAAPHPRPAPEATGTTAASA